MDMNSIFQAVKSEVDLIADELKALALDLWEHPELAWKEFYAAETLFAAGVDPRKPGKNMTLAECEKIVLNAKNILTRAIARGGTTISDFRHVDGSEGKFVQDLKIYGKEGESCPECGSTIQSVRLGGRASCFCPECQK